MHQTWQTWWVVDTKIVPLNSFYMIYHNVTIQNIRCIDISLSKYSEVIKDTLHSYIFLKYSEVIWDMIYYDMIWGYDIIWYDIIWYNIICDIIWYVWPSRSCYICAQIEIYLQILRGSFQGHYSEFAICYVVQHGNANGRRIQ